MDRKKLIQLIHIAKHKLALDEYVYRELLKNATNKTSCSDMGVLELEKVLTILKNKGFKVSKNTHRRFNRVNHKDYVNYTKNFDLKVKSNLAYKIRAVWINMYKEGLVRDGSDAGLNAFIRKQMKNTHDARNDKILVFSYQKLNDMQANLILKRLWAWRKRLIDQEVFDEQK